MSHHQTRSWSTTISLVGSSLPERVELAPNLGAGRRDLPLTALALILPTAAGLVRRVPLVIVAGGDVVLATLFLALFLGARNLRIFADDGGPGWVDRLGRARRFPPGTR